MAEKRGIVMPFRVTAGDADVATSTGDRLRETRISTTLGTRASSAGEIGELAWDPDRGSRLDALRNATAGEAVADFAALYVEEALAYALPNESLREVGVVLTDRTIQIETKTSVGIETNRAARLLSVTTRVQR